MSRFTVYKDVRGQYRWKFYASNGEVVAVSSESYTSLENASNGVRLLQESASAQVTVEVAETNPHPDTTISEHIRALGDTLTVWVGQLPETPDAAQTASRAETLKEIIALLDNTKPTKSKRGKTNNKKKKQTAKQRKAAETRALRANDTL